MKKTSTNLPYPTASYIALEILDDHFRIKWRDPTQQNILVYIFKKQNNFLQIQFYFERFKHARSKLPPRKIFCSQSHSDCPCSACNCVKNVQIRSFFWSDFSGIWPEYGDFEYKLLYSLMIKRTVQTCPFKIATTEHFSFPKSQRLFVQCLQLREKCPNPKFFLVSTARIFPYFPHLDSFSPNAGKYGPEKTPYLDTFHAVCNIYFLCFICYKMFYA